MNKTTYMQDAFAVEYASNGGNATQAAVNAGYSQKSAHEIGRQLLEKPHVHQKILNELNKLRYKSGAVGLNALIQIAQNERVTPNARVNAAKALCEHAGLMRGASDDKGFNKPNDMTPEVTPGDIIALFDYKRSKVQK